MLLCIMTVLGAEGWVVDPRFRAACGSGRSAFWSRGAPRRMRILGGDDSVRGEDQIVGMGTKLFGEMDQNLHLKTEDDLNHDHIAELARIAAYQSNTKLASIEQVHVHEVAEDHVELQVISCGEEEEQCLALDLDVPLPQPCDGFDNEEDFEECVLNNIAELSAMFNEAAEEEEYDAEADMRQWAAELKESELAETAARMQTIMNGFVEELTILMSAAESETFLVPSPPRLLSIEMRDLTPRGFWLTGQLEGAGAISTQISFQKSCSNPEDFQQQIMALVCESEKRVHAVQQGGSVAGSVGHEAAGR